jgi:hypothetical protein
MSKNDTFAGRILFLSWRQVYLDWVITQYSPQRSQSFLILSPRSRRLCGKIEMWVVVRFGHIDQARYNQKWNNLRGGFARHAIRQIGRLSSAKPAKWR